jgi:diaminohydroxyphosphoribosylaminopyrimidine deaminase/5-amino-6-(5-phosphoribosylamino)uracil reductase
MIESGSEDPSFMASALMLGRRGLGRTWPNPAVGAVIVRDNIIIGRGWTQPGGRPHAEVEALRRAGAAARGATLYVTLEPCSHYGRTAPCADAIIATGIRRVVSAMEDPNPDVAGRGHARLRAAGIEVAVGEGAETARRDHAGHILRMRDGRPRVTLKLAVSFDGKVALAGRRPVMLTDEPARAHVHLMRAMNDAILIGIGTALADDPALTCRLPGMAARSPVRVVLDTDLRLPPTSRLAQTARETPVWVFAGSSARDTALRETGVEVLRADAADGRLDLGAVLRTLGERGISRLLVEGGPTVAASLLAANLIDEAVILRSPKLLGADGIGAIEGLPLEALTRAPQLRRIDAETVGTDVIERFERTPIESRD